MGIDVKNHSVLINAKITNNNPYSLLPTPYSLAPTSSMTTAPAAADPLSELFLSLPGSRAG